MLTVYCTYLVFKWDRVLNHPVRLINDGESSVAAGERRPLHDSISTPCIGAGAWFSRLIYHIYLRISNPSQS